MYTFNNNVLNETSYLKNPDNDEYYPRDPTTNAEFPIGNTYAKDHDGNELYPKDKDNNQFIVAGRYARDSDKNESYPKDKDDNEISSLSSYAKDKDGNELYPKAYLRPADLSGYPLGTQYAKDKDGKYKYPQSASKFYVLLYADETPTFIPNDTTVTCEQLNEAVTFKGKKYVFAKTTAGGGTLYLSVMQSASDTVYKKWKLAEPGLLAQYKKLSKKYKAIDVYVRGADEYFVLDGNTKEEIPVVFDKKFRMHVKVKGQDYYRDYWTKDLYYDKLYRRKYFMLSADKKTKHYLLSYGNKVYYKRKSSSEIESYTLDNNGDEVAGKTLAIEEFYQSMNAYQVMFFHMDDKKTYIFENDEFILIDFTKKKQSFHKYYMKGGNKQYFEWDAGAKKDINAPTDDLNEESDAETDIGVKVMEKDIEKWSVFFCVYMTLLIVGIFSAIVYIYYKYIRK